MDKNKKVAKELLKIAEELMKPHYMDPRLVKEDEEEMCGENDLDCTDNDMEGEDEFHSDAE